MERALGLFGFFFENLVYLFALIVLLQLAVCYAVQAIADKQGVAHTWLAWIPLVQIYPVVMAGSESFQPFLGLLGAGLVAAIASLLLGPLGGLLALAWSAWALFYFIRLFWTTAERRGLSGWVGLLAFVPGLNVAACLYVAFHDGAVAPSRAGLLLGLLFVVLPAVPEARKARQIAQIGSQLEPLAAAARQGDEAEMRRLLFESAETLEGAPGFEADEDAQGGLSQALSQLVSAFGGGDDDADGRADTDAEVAVPELAPLSPFFECPPGTRERGAAPPAGSQRWCERADASGGRVRHGGYAAWHPNGLLHETGLYRDGAREGVWTRWYANGAMQVQAEFENGRQQGFQLEWSESGLRLRELRFADGAPAGSSQTN